VAAGNSFAVLWITSSFSPCTLNRVWSARLGVRWSLATGAGLGAGEAEPKPGHTAKTRLSPSVSACSVVNEGARLRQLCLVSMHRLAAYDPGPTPGHEPRARQRSCNQFRVASGWTRAAALGPTLQQRRGGGRRLSWSSFRAPRSFEAAGAEMTAFIKRLRARGVSPLHQGDAPIHPARKDSN
jgi:hypothetical protein